MTEKYDIIPSELTEEQLGDLVIAFQDFYRKKGRRNIAQMIQGILIKLGVTKITHNDKNLIRLCYLTAKRKNGEEAEWRVMYQCVYNAMRTAPSLFEGIPVRKGNDCHVEYVLRTDGLPCSARKKNGACGKLKRVRCDRCKIGKCPYFTLKVA